MRRDCCSEVLPENSARTFTKPTSLVRRAFDDGLIPRNASVLEVGGGCLRNSSFLLTKGYQVSVMELQPVVDRYREKYDQFRRIGGKLLTQWPKPQAFDIVVSTFTLETICRKDERYEHLNKLIWSLKKGGRLMLAVRGPKDVKTATRKGRKCGDGYITPLKTFIKPFTVRELLRLLENRGIRIMRLYGGSRENEPKIIEIVAEKL